MPTHEGHTIRAGDAVKHGPTGQTWLVATDEERGEFMAAGWPETLAYAKDCTLDTAATDEERLDLLREVAASRGDRGGCTYRSRTAARQLEASDG